MMDRIINEIKKLPDVITRQEMLNWYIDYFECKWGCRNDLTSGELMKGLIIILGMLIFTIFVSTFLDTHEKVLNILNNKLTERDSYYKDEEPSMYKNYKAKIKELVDLVINIKNRILVVKYANWILTFIATSVFCYLNK